MRTLHIGTLIMTLVDTIRTIIMVDIRIDMVNTIDILINMHTILCINKGNKEANMSWLISQSLHIAI